MPPSQSKTMLALRALASPSLRPGCANNCTLTLPLLAAPCPLPPTQLSINTLAASSCHPLGAELAPARRLLPHARSLLFFAAREPPCLRAEPLNGPAWMALVTAIEALGTR